MRADPRSRERDDPAGLWAPELRALTCGLVLGATLIAVEALAVVTIAPGVVRDLGGLDLYGWIFSSFMLASLIGAVAGGREADRGGPAPPFLGGLVLFALGLLIAGCATSIGVLVLGRAVQGLGAGAVGSVSYVVVGRALPESLRPRMMAVLSSAWVLPGLLAPVLSAAVASLLGWRWVFLGLLPLILLAGSLAAPALLRLGPPGRTRPAPEQRLRHALLAAGGCALALAAVGAQDGPASLAMLAAGMCAAVAGLHRLLPAGTLRARPGLPAVILGRGLLTFAFFGADSFIALTITAVLHRGSAAAGAAITASTLAWTAGAWLQVRLGRSIEGRRLVRGGLALLLAGIAGMIASLAPGTPLVAPVAAWTLAGAGMGLAYAPTSLMMLREASTGREGWAAASLSLADVLGTALGAGVGGAAIAAGSAHGWPLTTSLAIAFAAAGCAGVAGLALGGRLPSTLAARAPAAVGARAPVAAKASAAARAPASASARP